jgi:hypothetical protein
LIPALAPRLLPPHAADLWRYDTIYETYTQLASMPAPYTRFAYAASDTSLFVVGGIGGDADIAWCWKENVTLCLPAGGFNLATVDDASGANPGRTGDRVFSYNISTDAWALSPARLNVPRSDACAAVINGKLYVVGASGVGFDCWRQRVH